MSEQLAKVQLGKIFLKSFRREVEQARDEALAEGAKILRREEEASIRQRWYLLGRTLGSLQEEVISEGDRKIYRLTPTAPHAIFGEYGTGQRGKASYDPPQPSGWKYGDQPGMRARIYSRIAVGIARPQVEDVFRLKVQELANRLTR
jgi:hypothetical protein